MTQNRNVADTALVVVGEPAKQWMAIAQCFAGNPENPPAPGVRTGWRAAESGRIADRDTDSISRRELGPDLSDVIAQRELAWVWLEI